MAENRGYDVLLTEKYGLSRQTKRQIFHFLTILYCNTHQQPAEKLKHQYDSKDDFHPQADEVGLEDGFINHH